MAYKTFEDLEVYKAARDYRKKIYQLIKELPDQENIQFCRVSRGSLMELIDDLNVCIDVKYFYLDYLKGLKEEGYRVNKMLNGYIAYLKKRRNEKNE